MSGSKNARSTPSISNKTTIYGIIGGPVRATASNIGTFRHQQIKGSRGLPELNGKSFAFQFNYLKMNKLLSVNPLASGGVGKKSLMFRRT